jgi:hypothetical protein
MALWVSWVIVERVGEMKDFYGSAAPVRDEEALPDALVASYIRARARVAVYDGPVSAPYIAEIGPGEIRDYIESLSAKVYELARTRGGDIPYTVIRELVENYIHAGFAEPVVSILDGGSTIRFSDQGPGIPDKDLALRPGYTTAAASMKGVIRGVGSGLPIVREFLAVTGGVLDIDDNLRGGSVITISSRPRHDSAAPAPVIQLEPAPDTPSPGPSHSATFFDLGQPPEQPISTESGLRLTTRQKQVLALVLENGTAGPSIVSRELKVGLSTAYRDLASLEALGLIASEGGKRALTSLGLSYLGGMSSPGRRHDI